LQEHVPILVGGSGEKRTLRLVARYADACNFFGEPDDVRRKLAVLRSHCEAVERDPAEINVTHLGRAMAASTEEQVGRYRELAEAGVETAIVGLSFGSQDVAEFAEVIGAFG
jgi:alkanesulfonate monooxygenase SsuD/methylene tetrahydromethanopterin reductase-like flavin-dependent oxidoreductase (luciferase family)